MLYGPREGVSGHQHYPRFFFVRQALGLKQRTEPGIPAKLKFFLEIRDSVEFLTSVATEAEIARELVAGFGLEAAQCSELWSGFIEKLKCRHIEEVVLDKRFGEVARKIPMKLRTLVNFIHIFVAMKEDAFIVSGDKDLIEICRKNNIYGKIVSYVEFRRLADSP